MNVETGSFMTADKAVILYNLRNKNPNYEDDGNCRFPMCREGKCICLDVQQAEVLQMVLNDHTRQEDVGHFHFDPDEVQKFVFDEIPQLYSACEHEHVRKAPFGLCSFKRFPQEDFKNFLKSIPRDNRAYAECLSLFLGLSIFYYANRKEELCDRDSVLYLALHGNDNNGIFLNLLFDNVTMALIDKTIRGESVDSIGKAIEKMCCRLRQLKEDSAQTLKMLSDIMEAFIRDINAVEIPVCRKLENSLRDYKNDMNVFRQYCNTRGVTLRKEEVFDEEEKKIIARMEANEEAKIQKVLPHYALMKRVCEYVKLEISWQDDFYLEYRLRSAVGLCDDDISKMITILQKSSQLASGTDIKKSVLRKIQTLLSEYVKEGFFTSESMNELEKIFNKCN